ncbi:MAG TPA: dihydrodipicolinate synthase family protein [Thermomicrobiales bacterium]
MTNLDRLVPMTERLTRENLHGVWAATATPFDEEDRFDEGVFRENIRRLHAAGVHGIYTTDSDGEFYAIELDEFRRIVDVFADEARRLGFPTMVGVTWCNTRGMLDRLRHAANRGILGAHVGHPFFMPMTPESYRVFWDDVSRAVPAEFALIHYNTPRVHNYQRGPDYAVLQAEIPNLVGTKHVSADVSEFMTLMACAGELSHFTGEHAMTPLMMLGARGVYSWFVNFNARYMVDWYDDVVAGRWDAAYHRQERMHAFIQSAECLRGSGNLHAIVGKAVTAASSFLVPANRTRRPYLPVPDETVRTFRRLTEEEFPDLVWRG